jgi:hypothetical protein
MITATRGAAAEDAGTRGRGDAAEDGETGRRGDGETLVLGLRLVVRLLLSFAIMSLSPSPRPRVSRLFPLVERIAALAVEVVEVLRLDKVEARAREALEQRDDLRM